MFTQSDSKILDRITPSALAVKLSDPRYSHATKRGTLEHAMRAALADGDNDRHAELLAMWRGLCGLSDFSPN